MVSPGTTMTLDILSHLRLTARRRQLGSKLDQNQSCDQKDQKQRSPNYDFAAPIIVSTTPNNRTGSPRTIMIDSPGPIPCFIIHAAITMAPIPSINIDGAP